MSTFSLVDEPIRGAIGDFRIFQHSGFEALRRMSTGEFPGPPPSRLMGSRVTDVGLGTVSFSMPVSPWLEDSFRVVEAGVFAFFADAPLACALWSGLPAGKTATTSEINMSFVRPATHATTDLIGRAETIHLGRQIRLSSIRITDQSGRLMAHGTTKCLVLDVPVDPDAHYPAPDTGPDDPPDPYRREAPGPEAYYTDTEMTEGAPIELMRESVDRETRFPIWQMTGFTPVAVEHGALQCRIPTSPWFSNGGPAVYGGALAWLADHAMGGAVFSTLGPGDLFAALDLNVRYTRPAMTNTGDLTCRARVRHEGRRLRVSSAEITDSQDRTVAMGTASALVVRDGSRKLVAGRNPVEILSEEEG